MSKPAACNHDDSTGEGCDHCDPPGVARPFFGDFDGDFDGADVAAFLDAEPFDAGSRW